jgi:hypothetical protein
MRLAEDAVAVRRTRARGVTESVLRRQLAAVPTPRLRRFVFVRRLTIRAGPNQIGRAMEAAIARLADEEGAETLAFPDLPALVVACARDAASGALHGWHWQTLGLPRMATQGEAVAALLTAHPREAGSAVAALAAQGLLAAVWRTMPDAAAGRLTAALMHDSGFATPAWPSRDAAAAVQPMPQVAAVEVLLARAAAFWAPLLAPLRPRAEAVRTAAVMALLRWSPSSLRSPNGPTWSALLARIAPDAAISPPRTDATPKDAASPSHTPAAPQTTAPDAATAAATAAADPPADPLPWADPARSPLPHGLVLATGWGGVLFLVNALRRLRIEILLDAEGEAAPSGWRVLHAIGTALGLPPDEPLAQFLDAQDLETSVKPAMLAVLLDGIAMLYRDGGPWPLPLAQLARLRATETHLDLDLQASSVDLALRLAGLDLDPGWVPWLGRVVAFHYPAMPTQQRRGP